MLFCRDRQGQANVLQLATVVFREKYDATSGVNFESKRLDVVGQILSMDDKLMVIGQIIVMGGEVDCDWPDDGRG